MSKIAQGILIGIIGMLCIAAVPYGAELACVYVRQMDLRDTLYQGVIMPPAEWSRQYGGLTERNVVFFNFKGFAELVGKYDQMQKEFNELKKQIAPADPNTTPDKPIEDPNR